jgi:hypothetical protein
MCCSDSNCFILILYTSEGKKKVCRFRAYVCVCVCVCMCACVHILWNMVLERVMFLLCILSLVYSSVVNLSTFMVLLYDVQK